MITPELIKNKKLQNCIRKINDLINTGTTTVYLHNEMFELLREHLKLKPRIWEFKYESARIVKIK